MAATSAAPRRSLVVAAVRCFLAALALVGSARAAPTVNILFVNDEGNSAAEKAVGAALEKLKKAGGDFHVDRVSGNGTDAHDFLDKLCKVYNDSLEASRPPHLVLDTTISGVPSEVLKSFTYALALPTLSASHGQEGDLRQWRNLDEEKEKYLVQIMPPADMLPEVIRSIAYTQNISNAAVLFDDSIVMDHKYKSLLQNMPTRHVIVKAGENLGIKEQLAKLRGLDLFNFFVIGRLSTIKTVLDFANINKFFATHFAWHAITLESGNLKCSCSDANILFLQPEPDAEYKDRVQQLKNEFGLDEKPEITSAFYFDFAVNALNAIKSMVEAGTFPTDIKYVTCDEYTEETAPTRTNLGLMEALKEVKQEPSYAPIRLEKNGLSYMEFTLKMTRANIVNSKLEKSEEVGTWKAGFDEPLQISDESILSNMTAITFYRIVTVEQKPFIIKDGVDEKGRPKFKGYCVDLINEIRNITEFEYEIFEAPDGKMGNMNEKGQWDGMIKELIEKRADIALGSLAVMAERENVIDFTVPYYDLVGITVLMKKPKAPTSLFKFLTVLEKDVWLCILAAYFFTSFLMWVFDRWSPYSYQNNREKYKDDDEKREFNLKECLWFCMTSLTPQGGGEAPKNLSGRLVAATWWLFGFIIIASYTANLAAFLTVSRLDTPVESLEDLSKQYKIQYAPLNGSSAMTYFQRMADIENRFYEIWKDMSLNDSLSDVERAKLAVWDYPVSDKYTKIWQAMKEAKFPNTMEEALDRVFASKSSSEGFAFIGDATDIRYLVLTNCDLQMVGEEFSRKPYAIAVQQGSPLKDLFNNAILQLLNKRKLEKLKEIWWNQNPERKVDCEKSDDQSDGISIQNIGGVFIVIFVGIGMACITLAFEYWWYKYRKDPKVVDVSQPAMVRQAVAPSKLDAGVTMGFRPRPIHPDNFRRHNMPLAGVANPW
ncbi:ionotropic receptor 25a [Bacillus rossius redtenbacheri]|uniref:ionotropic receptor 25a n=1 Tax=Bacillus rossius redtenbacheri TaxID=93214 RepID=UPI002FDEE7D2